MSAQHGVNSIEIDGTTYLLAGISGSHLAPEAQPGEPAVPAVPEWRVEMDEDWQSAYDMPKLAAEQWRATTLCGREWLEMEAGDGPALTHGAEPVFAPGCRTCLRVVGQHLTFTPPDERISVIVALVVDRLREHRSATIQDVPGDQLEHLRAAIRTGLREEGIRANTHPVDSTVFVVQNTPIDETEELAAMERAVSVLNYFDSTPREPPDHVINWYTWGS